MVFNGRMISRDLKIQKLGYVESKGKKGLFYKKCFCGIAYLDHRINDDYPFRDQYEGGPRFYFTLEKPQWQSIRVRRYQEQLLYEHEVKFVPSMRDYNEILGEMGRPQDGFCNFCNKDFQDEGWFCSSECQRLFHDQVKTICEACYQPIDDFSGKSSPRHHVSYFPEETIIVHQNCHIEIHRSDKYLHLRPPDDDKDRFYHKGKYASKDTEIKSKSNLEEFTDTKID